MVLIRCILFLMFSWDFVFIIVIVLCSLYLFLELVLFPLFLVLLFDRVFRPLSVVRVFFVHLFLFHIIVCGCHFLLFLMILFVVLRSWFSCCVLLCVGFFVLILVICFWHCFCFLISIFYLLLFLVFEFGNGFLVFICDIILINVILRCRLMLFLVLEFVLCIWCCSWFWLFLVYSCSCILFFGFVFELVISLCSWSWFSFKFLVVFLVVCSSFLLLAC